jgi:hypothetical protein
MTDSPFNPDRLRIDAPQQQWAEVPKKIQKRRKGLIMVPGLWQEQLTKAQHIATYRVALHILRRHWESGGKPFKLSNGAVALEGVTRWRKWEALAELEKLGLITVERRKRRSPQITVLCAG